ncbi:MAG: 3-hydroxyacyl-CoA dehydrogenase family protein [Clostridium sp.]
MITANTSGMSINLLSRSVKWPERFIGMHWFNPPHLVPPSESYQRRKDARRCGADGFTSLSLKIGKSQFLVNRDIPGFAANRLQFAILREALDLVAQGVVSAEGIDDVVRYGLGFRYACLGPLEVADFGGLALTFTHISSYLMKDLCDSKEVPELMQAHFDAGEYGVKSEKGFYDYSDGRAKEATRERMRSF